MKRKGFNELAGNKLCPFGHIIGKFGPLADVSVADFFEGCMDLWEAMNGICRFDDDATVYDVAKEIFDGYTQFCNGAHEYSEEDLRACRLMLYFTAGVVKQINERSSSVLTAIDRSTGLNRLQDFATFYSKGELMPAEKADYSVNGSRTWYAQLFEAMVRDLDGASNSSFAARSLPTIDSCDIFYLRSVACMFDTFYRILIIPIVAAKDVEFANRVREQKI